MMRQRRPDRELRCTADVKRYLSLTAIPFVFAVGRDREWLCHSVISNKHSVHNCLVAAAQDARRSDDDERAPWTRESDTIRAEYYMLRYAEEKGFYLEHCTAEEAEACGFGRHELRLEFEKHQAQDAQHVEAAPMTGRCSLCSRPFVDPSRITLVAAAAADARVLLSKLLGKREITEDLAAEILRVVQALRGAVPGLEQLERKGQ